MELKELKDMIEPVENWEYELSGTRQVGKSYIQNLLNNKNKVINDLLKRISNLEFEVERLENENKEFYKLMEMQNKREYRSKFLKDFQKEYGKNVFPDYDEIYKRYDDYKSRIDKAIEYINNCSLPTTTNEYILSPNHLIDILKGVDKE